MDNFQVITGKREHINQVVKDIRDADKLEFERATGMPVRATLHLNYRPAAKNWTAFHGDKIVLMAGVHPHYEDENVGIPWMVGTTHLEGAALSFLRECAPVIEEMKVGYDRLMNYVDADNKKAINWLKWLGFTILESEPYGASRLPFHKFEMEIKRNV